MLRSIFAILAFSLVALACDAPDSVIDERAGLSIVPTMGETFGPCLHDDATEPTYHWCKPVPEDVGIAVCAIPQAPDAPPVTVCLVRQAECPIAMNGYLMEQDYAHACAIACEDEEGCPSGMLCVAGTCAWETF